MKVDAETVAMADQDTLEQLHASTVTNDTVRVAQQVAAQTRN